MPSNKPNHLHKFKRQSYKNTGTKFFFCVNDCDYKVAIELSLGKISQCWRCGQPFAMNQYAMRLAKPHCPDCHKSQEEIKKNGLIVARTQREAAIASVVANDLRPSIDKVLQESNDSAIEDLRNRLKSIVDDVKEDDDLEL